MLKKAFDIFNKISKNAQINRYAFTIVELLIVVVVIGVLATITIVSYTGINKRAVVASISSDLDNASRQLKLFQVDFGYFPDTISTDCISQPDSSTNKCLKNSGTNIFSYYRADNNYIPQTFTLRSNNNSIEYAVNNNGSIVENNQTTAYISCLDIFNNGKSIGDGFYTIKPESITTNVFCDMTNGGWTRLNSDISASSTAYDEDDRIVTPNIPGGCATPGCAFTVDSISVPHTHTKTIIVRSTSIVQCPSIEGSSTSNTYFENNKWISRGTCVWNDGVFANGTSRDMANLKQIWKLEGAKSSTNEIKFTSRCSGSDDNGIIKATNWVR